MTMGAKSDHCAWLFVKVQSILDSYARENELKLPQISITTKIGHHETQHNDTQHNDTHDIKHIKHNNKLNVTLCITSLSIMAVCCYAGCHYAE